MATHQVLALTFLVRIRDSQQQKKNQLNLDIENIFIDKKKKELIAKGLKPYNEKEAKWCKDNHIPYDGVDYKVYKNDECWYEYCLLGCRLPRSRSFVITNPDGRNMKYRGMTNEDIINKDNHDVNKILQEDLDIKTKLTLCLSVDKTLYTKFIRNENQTKCRIGKIDRQSR